MSDRLLHIEQLSVHIGDQPVIEKLSLALNRGETLVLAGESGSGKSLTALSVARLLPVRVLVETRPDVAVAARAAHVAPARAPAAAAAAA